MSAKEMLDFVEKAYKEGNMPVWDYEKFKEEFKEKTAREMFKELGYEYERSNDNYLRQSCISYYKFIGKQCFDIQFWLGDKDYKIEGKELLTIDLVQAINKQIEELWGDEILKKNGNK